MHLHTYLIWSCVPILWYCDLALRAPESTFPSGWVPAIHVMLVCCVVLCDPAPSGSKKISKQKKRQPANLFPSTVWSHYMQIKLCKFQLMTQILLIKASHYVQNFSGYIPPNCASSYVIFSKLAGQLNYKNALIPSGITFSYKEKYLRTLGNIMWIHCCL